MTGEVNQEPKCVHHWILPEGNPSTGVCKKCGTRKDFNARGGVIPFNDNEVSAKMRLQAEQETITRLIQT